MKKNLLFFGLFMLMAWVSVPSKATLKSTTDKNNTLDFNVNRNYTKEKATLNGKTIEYRAYKSVVYVSKPIDAAYQCMNVFIPEAYFNGKSINGYTATTAPIFLPNQVGGYMPGKPGTTTNEGMGMGRMGGQRPQGMGGSRPEGMPRDMGGERPQGMPGGQRPEGMGRPQGMNGEPPQGMGQMPQRKNTILEALAKGYVVASPGARGRSLKDSDGKYYGKAPAFIVDMKAAVRYLHYNDATMPGNAEKIISNGTSAGGALSALLGATCNSKDYEPYLNEIGAAQASDAIFAVSAYCPITNLDHANEAYEWMFNASRTFKAMMNPEKMVDYKVKRETTDATLTADQITISNELKQLFPTYLNSLNLKDKNGHVLSLDANGNGSFKEYVKSYIIASAQKALDKGTDLSKTEWLTIENGKVTDMDFDKYIQTIQRQKTPGAFDAMDCSTAENNEFGTETTAAQHFTQYAMEHSTVKATMADAQIIKMLNPMNYIGTGDATPAQHWRIRHGEIDRDTSSAIPLILATKLENNGYDVDVALPWNTPHSGDYDLDELFAWIDGLCK